MAKLNLNRREFLKIMGVAGTLTAVGCGRVANTRLIPYVAPPGDIAPGQPAWFSTSCRECPAGCGMLVKNLDGRAIKVEGNPVHPVNHGKLCARGQASLHKLYNPDRHRGPLAGGGREGGFPVSWDAAQSRLAESISHLTRQGKGDRIVLITDLVNGTLGGLIAYFMDQTGGEHIACEPYAYEALRTANRMVFGQDAIPAYDIAGADFLISLNAPFLETWVSNVEYARAFSRFHAPGEKEKNFSVWVGPRMSMTAASADLPVIVPPGGEYLVAAALLHYLLERGALDHLPADEREQIKSLIQGFSPEAAAKQTGVNPDIIQKIGDRFARAKKPLVLADGLSLSGPHALEAAVAANLLCKVRPGTRDLIDFSRPHALGEAAAAARMKDLTERMHNGKIALLMVHDANPAFTLPAGWKFQEAMKNVPVKVSFSSCEDETSRFADLILPAHTPLESWGDYRPRKEIFNLVQPSMGTICNTRHLGDILLAAGQAVKGRQQFPAESFEHVIEAAWRRINEEQAPDIPFERFWLKARQRGGIWDAQTAPAPESAPGLAGFSFPENGLTEPGSGKFHFTAYPTIQFFDGRMANRPWIQELPDPLTQTTWGGWVEIHPDDAGRENIQKGDLVDIISPFGRIRAPALPIFTVPPGTLAMPIGQGHDAYGMFASRLPANPFMLFAPAVDERTGGPGRTGFAVAIEKTGGRFPIAHTDGSYFQHDRRIHQEMDFSIWQVEQAAGKKPDLIMPLPEGYTGDNDIYPPHDHADYRWSMVVDLDRCIGCGACVVACYAENNVAFVGREQVLMGREMSWIRVQRYFDETSHRPGWLVMLCQHCDCAPCESVCPIYAPQHSPEGLNNQVYNRCFGTRFCSQNDPYKVRRFNWFTFSRPWPLDYQLNPDVTVRTKGVMEKCSFCIQRIVEAKIRARNENRRVEDGDFTTACAQTCPADALVFGNLKDPQSRVSKMIRDVRTYQVLKHLNTKPAVFYLKRLNQEM